jgi:hypothetical protein
MVEEDGIQSDNSMTRQISDFEDGQNWTPAALAKLQNIPYFVRPQARQRIEAIARETGSEEITVEMVEQARLEFGQ